MKPKIGTKKKIAWTVCKDCGAKYLVGAAHIMFCPAHTCDICGTTYGHVVHQQDRREEGLVRVCDNCVEEGL
jgi:rRNA maturation endonuclease Nob1